MENTEGELEARVTPPAASTFLGIHIQSVYDAIARKTLPARKSKTGYTIKKEDLLAFKARTQPEGVPRKAGRPKKEASHDNANA